MRRGFIAADSSTNPRPIIPAPMQPKESVRAAAAAALAYFVLAILWAAPASLSPADTLPDLGDPVHLSYVMAWDAHQLVRDPLSLFDSNSFYPYPRSLTFGDHLLPEALLVAPVNWATGNAVLASNLGVLLALTLSGLAMFLLVRRLTGSNAAAFLAGLAYAFNSFTRQELFRVHVLSIQWWPLALLFLDRFVRDGRRRSAWGLAGMLVLEGLSGTYYLVYTALLAPLWLLIAFASERRWPRRAEVRALGIALAVTSLPMLVVLAPYLMLMRTMGFEKGLEPGVDVLSYLLPLRGHALWGWLSPLRVPGSGGHFVGYVTLALAAIGCLRARSGWARIAAIATALLGFGLSLGWSIYAAGHELMPGPYRLLYSLFPPARGMAGPERFGVLVVLGAALLVGLGSAALLERLRGSARVSAGLALAVLLPLEHWSAAKPAAPVPTGRDLPAAYAWLAAQSRAPMVDLPLYPDIARRLFAVYLNLSTQHWRPIPFGRTSFYPPIHDLLAWYTRDFPDAASITLLEQLGIRTILIHPKAWEDEFERQERMSALEDDRQLELVKRFDDEPPERYATLNLGHERVYRIRSQTPAPVAPCAPANEVPREGWEVAASCGNPKLALDGDRRTAWRTEYPQKPGDSFEVELPRPERLSAVALDMHYPHGEFPRALRLLSRVGERWERVAYGDGPAERWSTIHELLERPKQASLILRFPAREMTRLRLSLGSKADASWPAWAIPELHLYRECR